MLAASLALLFAAAVVPLAAGPVRYALLTGAIAVVALAALPPGRPPRALALPLLLLLGWAAAGLAWAPGRYPGVSGLLWLVALVGLALGCARRGFAALDRVGGAWLLVATPVLTYGLVQYGGLAPKDGWASPLRLAGPFTNSNLYAAYAGVSLCLALARLVRPGPVAIARRAGFALVALLAAISLPLTVSRGGWLATAAGVAVVVALRARAPRSTRGSRAAAMAALALLGAVALAGCHSAARIGERLRGAGSYSASHRYQLYRGTLELVRARPLGVGLGGFAPAFVHHRLHADRFAVRFAHSEPLHIAAELGLPGLALVVVLLARLGSALRADGALADARTHPALAALAVLLTHSLYDFPLRKPALALLAAAVLGCLAGGRAGRPAVARAARLVTGAAVLALALPLGYGELLRHRAATRAEAGDLLVATALYARADRLLIGGDVELARTTGAIHARLGAVLPRPHRDQARRWYGRALARHPGDGPSLVAAAVLAASAGERAEALALYRRAAAASPKDGRIVGRASDAAAAAGDYLTAVRLAGAGLDLVPGRFPPAQLVRLAERGGLPPELVAAAVPAGSAHAGDVARRLEQRGMHLAARLIDARRATLSAR